MARFTLFTTLLLTALLALPGGAEGLVLCLCHDGHVSLEVGCEPESCCPPVECTAVHGPEAGEGHGTEHPAQHSCTDIPVPAGIAQFEAAPVAPVQVLTLHMQALPLAALASEFTLLHTPRVTAIRDSSLYTAPDTLRTVILLI